MVSFLWRVRGDSKLTTLPPNSEAPLPAFPRAAEVVWPDAESIQILSAIRRGMPAGVRVLIIETVVPDVPGPHLSKELDIAMMALPGGMERTQEQYGSLAAKSALRLERMVETLSPYSVLEMVAA